MKKFLLSLAFVGSVVLARATGSIPANSAQNGTVNFVATNAVTVSFATPFTYPPVMQLFGSVTNLYPITNSVTTTNFTVTIAATNATGVGWGTVLWAAQQGATLIEYGTVTNAAAATGVNVTFPTPFAYAPQVFMQGSLTNATAVEGVQSVTFTNFTYGENIATTNNWMAIGTAANAGTTVVTH